MGQESLGQDIGAIFVSLRGMLSPAIDASRRRGQKRMGKGLPRLSGGGPRFSVPEMPLGMPLREACANLARARGFLKISIPGTFTEGLRI